jgi:hypothetical protein
MSKQVIEMSFSLRILDMMKSRNLIISIAVLPMSKIGYGPRVRKVMPLIKETKFKQISISSYYKLTLV